MFNDQVFKFELICKLVNSIKHIVSLSVEVFLACVQEILGLIELVPKFL